VTRRRLGSLGLAALASALTSLAGAPASAEPCPEWTRGKAPAEYPIARFVVGLGVAGGVWSADRGEEPGRNAALADISKQLRVDVASTTVIRERESTSGGHSASVQERSSTSSALVLQGARVVARCFQPESTTFYALAVLDRGDAAARVLADIATLNKQGAGELAAARDKLKGGDPLGAVASLQAALDAAARLGLQGQILVALTGKAAPDAFATGAQLEEVQDQLRAQTVVSIAVADSDELLRAKIKDGLARHRIQSAEGADASLLTVKARAEAMDGGRTTFGASIVRARVSLDLVRTSGGVVLLSATEEAKEGAATAEDARRKAVSRAADAVLAKLDRTIVKLLVPKAAAPGK
jgi:hypothetical protein